MTRTKWVNSHLKTSRWTIDDFCPASVRSTAFRMLAAWVLALTKLRVCVELSMTCVCIAVTVCCCHNGAAPWQARFSVPS